MSVLDSLPERPLTESETERLVETKDEFAPLCFRPEVPSRHLYVFVIGGSRHHVVGYDLDDQAWVSIATFDELTSWKDVLERERIDAWIDNQYPDDIIDQFPTFEVNRGDSQ